MKTRSAVTLLVVALVCPSAAAPQPAPPAAMAREATPPPPPDYVIGPDDVLGIVYWREPDMGGDVTVRPDGKITLSVIGDLHAAGLAPAELQKRISAAAAKYLTDVNVAVIVRQINSRKVFVTGQVRTPGAHPLTNGLTVMQAIALAGGLLEYADAKNITILRSGGAGTQSLRFNYRDVAKGKNLDQNIPLRPGDTVVVP